MENNIVNTTNDRWGCKIKSWNDESINKILINSLYIENRRIHLCTSYYNSLNFGCLHFHVLVSFHTESVFIWKIKNASTIKI